MSEKLTEREEWLRAQALKAAASYMTVTSNNRIQLFDLADECLAYIKGERK